MFNFFLILFFNHPSWADPVALGRSDSQLEKVQKKGGNARAPEWILLESELQALTTQIRQKQTNLNNLIQEKKSAEDTKRVGEIIRELNSEQKNLKSMVETYDQRRTLLKYRYPERRASTKRRYEKIEVKDLELLEAQSVLARRMLSARKKIEKTYGIRSSDLSSANINGGVEGRSPASIEQLDSSNLEKSKSLVPPVKSRSTIRLIDETPILKR